MRVNERDLVSVALPQTGEMRGLEPGAALALSFAPDQCLCFPAAAGEPAERRAAMGSERRSLTLLLLLAPFLLWVLLLVVIPQFDLLMLSLARRSPRGSMLRGLPTTRDFFGEPAYVMTLVRTVVMSLLATALTFLVAFRSPTTSPRSPRAAPAARSSSCACCRSG